MHAVPGAATRGVPGAARPCGHAMRGLLKGAGAVVLLVALLLLGPLGVLAFGDLDLDSHWSQARMDSTGQAPDPATTPEPVVQVYGARTYHWRGAFGIHTWIAVKRRQAPHYTVYQVIGWNLRGGRSVVTVTERGPADFMWFNARPVLLAERRGDDVEALIDRVEQAVAAYPYPDRYSAWPGPNSNTFTAFVARRVPELRLDLPPTAIGKDYLPGGLPLASAPSGTGVQLSLFGLAGLTLALEEGIEANLLGLSFGVDLNDFALRLPGVGRVP